MSIRKFLSALSAFTAVWILFLYLLMALFPGAKLHWPMGASASGLFLLICMLLFFAGRKMLSLPNKNAFTGLVMVSVFGKMALSLALLFAYRAILHPSDKWFVGIFLLCYTAFTAFEVWFLFRMSKRA